jgi:hypothetical protein
MIRGFFFIARPPERNQPDGPFAPYPDDRPAAATHDGDGKASFLRPEACGRGQLGSPIEDQDGIREIDAMLCEVRAALGFVPFEYNVFYTKCIYAVDLDSFSYVSYQSLSKRMVGRFIVQFLVEIRGGEIGNRSKQGRDLSFQNVPLLETFRRVAHRQFG